MSSNLSQNHWARDAACSFGEIIASFHPDDITKAKELCKNCKVRKDCISWAAEVDHSFVAGGLSKFDRLMLVWQRVGSINESNFRTSDIYVRKVLR